MFLPITRYGPLDVPGGEDLISRFLERYGEWSYFETDFLRHVIPSGVRVLDIGAYVGTFSLGMLQIAPKKIVAVEANPMAYQFLLNNLKRNCAIDHIAVNAAVGTEVNSHGYWKYSQQNNFGSLQYLNEHPDEQSNNNMLDLSVTGITIKSLRQSYGDFEFLKLDIEGAELAALESDVDWIKSAHPTIWLECNEDPHSFLLYNFLAHLGYSIYYFSYPSHNPQNFFGATEPIFAVAFEAGVLCIPSDRYLPLPKHFIDAGCEFIKVLSAEHLRQCLWVTPRWGVPNWGNLSRSRLLATCAHLYNGDNYAKFLGGTPKAG